MKVIIFVRFCSCVQSPEPTSPQPLAKSEGLCCQQRLFWSCFLTDCTKHMSTFVLSGLDHCNSLLSDYPKHLEKLQKVQNSKKVKKKKRCKTSSKQDRVRQDHVSPHLRTLYWLPVQACIECNHKL